MRIELVTQSKYRTGTKVGDDVPLIVPGQVYGVFDGATDPRGTIVEGIGAGRLAALTVARAMADLAADPSTRILSGVEIVARLSLSLAERTTPLDLPIPPSTTLAVALDCGDAWRFVLLGDSHIRLNGRDLMGQSKIIDSVSTAARVGVFHLLRKRMRDLDQVELVTRRAVFLGLDQAVDEHVLDRAQADGLIAEAISATDLADHADIVANFLNGGIQSQYRFGNATGSPLCFDTMNGTLPQLGHVIDITREKNDIQSIEIFSDGYPDLPTDISATAWEACYHRAEEIDFHKTGQFATVKGATRDEFFDDRTVLVLSAI